MRGIFIKVNIFSLLIGKDLIFAGCELAVDLAELVNDYPNSKVDKEYRYSRHDYIGQPVWPEGFGQASVI